MAQRPLADITDYPQLIAALRKRRDELDVSGEWLDEIAGFPDRYAQKLLRGGSRPEEKVRRLSMQTLGADPRCARRPACLDCRPRGHAPHQGAPREAHHEPSPPPRRPRRRCGVVVLDDPAC